MVMTLQSTEGGAGGNTTLVTGLERQLKQLDNSINEKRRQSHSGVGTK